MRVNHSHSMTEQRVARGRLHQRPLARRVCGGWSLNCVRVMEQPCFTRRHAVPVPLGCGAPQGQRMLALRACHAGCCRAAFLVLLLLSLLLLSLLLLLLLLSLLLLSLLLLLLLLSLLLLLLLLSLLLMSLLLLLLLLLLMSLLLLLPQPTRNPLPLLASP